MRCVRSFLCVLTTGLLASLAFAAAPPARPRLVVVLTVDQFRADYFPRFRAGYSQGLARIEHQGAVFSNAYYEHFPTVTAVGHATILTGAFPSLSGIVGNEWYDRELGKQVTSVSDPAVKLLGAGSRSGSSPRKLLVSTLGDEMKMALPVPPKVIGISLKDRSAILPAGRMADGAYWFDSGSGNFVSSSWYFDALPAWVEEFNRSRAADRFAGAPWLPFDASGKAQPFFTLAASPGKAYFSMLQRTPFANELLVLFARKAIEAESLGRRNTTDLLCLSLSANDYVGHITGPDSAEVRDISIRTDRLLGEFLAFLDSTVGPDHYLFIFTADHGVAPLPEEMQKRKMPGGRMTEEAVLERIQARLSERFGEGKWVLGQSGPAPYLDHALIRQRKLNLELVRETAAEAVREFPPIFRVYTWDQLARGQTNDDLVDRRVRNGFHAGRSADIFILPQPYWLFEEKGTTHGTPFHYDAHVPLVLLGPGIRAGRYPMQVAVNDIAPTLAALLDVEAPSGSAGRVLHEIFASR